MVGRHPEEHHWGSEILAVRVFHGSSFVPRRVAIVRREVGASFETSIAADIRAFMGYAAFHWMPERWEF
jgi:hypothetical protein